ncbi:autophagy-related protein 16-1 [Exaiptasia diaphana]|uniref:Autophagy-related protein 16 domain-containing protein n=1 Tax=Exaiptasia diaphana TaxID=2652724 RepID=A0A913X5G0_EXADI|nr:autophagy-related protein 16-1 [Exaiptasia diaphana]XP_020899203.1 autophagy-related protein 16-1 [Exaiptasia diaphana]KXJ15044.1 Autophagy-related protein 16-1 [Exaiptasia diaphana]KXJ16542.1 Autophagy-related protein 16-1 [Exaiptasia diaphana]
MAGEGLTWRKRILQKLGDRNLQELKYFDDLVKAHNRLFEVADSSKSKIIQLEIQTFQLQQERTELQGRIQELSASGAGAAAATATSEKVTSLEQKLFKTQEELTELHRWKSENAQHVTELMNQIRQKEEEVLQKEAQLHDAISNQNAMKTECQNLGQTIIDLQKANELIKDELQVLQLEHTSLEDKFKKTQEENRELVERWMIQKAKDADKVNMENELQVRTRQAQLQRELLEAAKEPVNIPNLSDSPHIPYCVITTIPAFPQTKFDAHDGEVLSAKFSISGRLFVTGGGDKKVKVWETGNDTIISKGTMHGCTYAVTSVQFDVQEKLILAASNDQACRVWTVADERLRHTLTGHQSKVMTAKFMGSDASKVVSGSHDRTLKIWDLRSKACIRTIFAGSSCNDLVINELIGSQIISGHFDKRVRFWDSRSDTSVGEITLQGKVTSLDLSPDMNQVLASTRDDTVKVIDLRMSQVVSTCSGDGFRLATDWTRACFSPDGQYVMCGSQDGSVYIWNNSTAKLEKVLKEHSSGVIVAAWHPTGTRIISCDRNKHAVVWSSRYG